MAATAKNYSSTNLIIGPGDSWGSLAVPGSGARITIASDGTPESVANPTAKHVGFTDQGAKCMYTAEIEKFEVDEQTAPVLSRILTESLSIEGAFMQGADLDIVDMFIMGAAKTSGTGYEMIALGGNTAVTGVSFALIVPTVASSTYFHVFSIYNAYNETGIEINVTRRDLARIPFKMTGLQVSSRTVGDRLGAIWKSVA